jgi:hypothetical protein
MHRDSAHRFADDRFDGTLFYQQWLSANILVERDAVYLPTLLAYFRDNSPTIFGTAAKERGLYTPGNHQPPEMHLKMVVSLIRIAEAVERERGVEIVERVREDFANHIYPTIARQTYLPWRQFFQFYRDLGAQGFWKYPQYHAWFWAIAVFRPRLLFWTFQQVRRVFGYSPNLTRFARPEPPAPARPARAEVAA